MEDKTKAVLLLGKAIDSMEDGVYTLASSFVDEALRYHHDFGEAHMIKALIVGAIKDTHPDPISGDFIFNTELDQAERLNPALEDTLNEIRSGHLTARNHRQWQALRNAGVSTASLPLQEKKPVVHETNQLPYMAHRTWETTTKTQKDTNVWRKDLYGAWIRKSDYDKTSEYGWRVHENPFHPGTYYAFQWENMTERSESGEGWVKKITSSGDSNIKYKSGCYIATVCYGNEDCNEIEVLRTYRDEVLSQNIAGRTFIKLYYLLSPSISQFMKTYPAANNVIKVHFLDVLVRGIKP